MVEREEELKLSKLQRMRAEAHLRCQEKSQIVYETELERDRIQEQYNQKNYEQQLWK